MVVIERRMDFCTLYPPSTTSAEPVQKDALRVHRNKTVSATSDGVPKRRSGMWSSWACLTSGAKSIGAVIGVSMTPGTTALTRIPSAAHCADRLRVSDSTPALAAP